MFFVTQEPSRTKNEDPKKWLKLSVFMLGVMKSEKPWEDELGQSQPSVVSQLGEVSKAFTSLDFSLSPKIE